MRGYGRHGNICVTAHPYGAVFRRRGGIGGARIVGNVTARARRGETSHMKKAPPGMRRTWAKNRNGPEKRKLFSGKVRSPQLGAIDGEKGRGFGKWIRGSGKRRKMTVRARIGALYIPIKNSKSISRGSSWPIRDGLSLARLPAPVGVCRACRGLRRSVF